MEIYFRIYQEQQLLIHQFNGLWSTQEYIDYVRISQKNPEMIFVKKILTDIRKLNFESIESILKDLEEKIYYIAQQTGKNYLNVHLVNDPVNVAVIHLYQEMLKKYNTYFYCTTIEQSIRLLNLPFTKLETENLLHHLQLFTK